MKKAPLLEAPYCQNDVIYQGVGIIQLIPEPLAPCAIVLVQSIKGAKPHIPIMVLKMVRTVLFDNPCSMPSFGNGNTGYDCLPNVSTKTCFADGTN